MKAEGRAVGVQVAVEVVPEQAGELVAGLDVGARVDHVATGQGFVEGWVVTAIELVHHDLPDWVGSAARFFVIFQLIYEAFF